MLIQLVVSVALTSASLFAPGLPEESKAPESQQSAAIAPEITSDSESSADTSATGSDKAQESEKASALAEWTLRYKFSPDQTLLYKSTETVTLDAMFGENRKVDVTGLEQRRLFTVTSVDPAGAAKLTMQYEFVRMQVQTDQSEPIVFDTTMKPEEIPPAFRNTARQLQGSAPRFWISNLGGALKESDQALGGVAASTSVARAGNLIVGKKKPDEEEGAEGHVEQAVATTTSENRTSHEKSKSENSDSSNAVTFLMPLPEEPVGISETWREVIPVSVRVTEDISRQVNILRTFRLESVENGIATISFRSSVEAAVKSPTMRSQLIKATPKGTLTFDIERGLMLNRVINYDEMVMNAIGQNSVVLCNGSSTETLLDDEAK